ncbi:hypothetical protein BU25DRAFT_412281 [Macroventuria anomochaeta]|uniref:Uncharacterized protein n=1 Tax=Macroventuria anomochaeta TaxID=301207 RepID=A0ACB6RW72_9PLEO|nr:uncharacterized protein BU25DRAFT_412281 [Macroventuria anomochaeta]KAF2626043.1 hypothetical protein BU25DRAFT_412281 [Macroventuria anomochaeta]
MASNTHSDLEVVAPSANDTYKYPYKSPEPIPAYSNTASDTNKIAYESATYERPTPARICGLRNRTFWIVVIAAIVVVAGAVGGGIGGALASRSSSNSKSSNSNSNVEAPQSSAQSSSTTQTPTSSTPTSSTQIISTSTIVGPTNSPEPTLLRDCPSSNNSIYSVTYGSTSYQFRKICNNAYLNVNGVSAQVQGVVKSLDDCIDRCAIYNRNNATEIQAGRDPICNAVCWRNTFDKTNDWEGGRCFGYTTQNTTVNGQTSFRITNTADICDSAALVNQDF